MTVGRHIRQLQEALMSAQPTLDTAGHWGRVLADVLPRHQRLLVAGNGGSAAQAQHLTAELVGRYPDDREPFAALALHSETSALTAIVDEYGAESMYARQVLAHGQQGDVCLLMSTSGHSRNLLAAAHAARQRGLRVWAMTGPRGNPLAAAADDALCVETAQDYTVQEVHLVALHVLCEEFERALQVAGMAETSS
ncbi:MAG TPA: SIS domain-containing protein [Jatrophihabitans sp.]|jgi:D-sedoheptulose 7-phosphate isomerase|nr:SIS domain-containing protein [Jatrophihabitans sp.]